LDDRGSLNYLISNNYVTFLTEKQEILWFSYNDGFVKNPERRFSVIPAQAGIQYFHVVRILWIPVFTGMTTFYESII
jgi:hypothetical protein